MENSDDGSQVISINTPQGEIQCRRDEIVCKRLGVSRQRRDIVLEYEVPSKKILAHHIMPVDVAVLQADEPRSGQPDTKAAEELMQLHGPWLAGVDLEQLSSLLAHLLNASPQKQKVDEQKQPSQPRRQRVQGIPPVARASKRSKDDEIRKVFGDVAEGDVEKLCLADLSSYMCDFLGFGQSDANSFFKKFSGASAGALLFDDFRKGYPELNPFQLANRKDEIIIRKPGSVKGQQVNLDSLEQCEVYVCDVTAQTFVDLCKGCVVLVAPCESSVFVRDCEDCTFFLACQQLRTRDCKRCTFHLYSKTEPIIETSQDLSFAPWTARYPGCSEQFATAKFDSERNLWNAIFDFSGNTTYSNWRIVPLEEIVELHVHLDEPEGLPSSPDSGGFSTVTHEALCKEPLASGDSCGEGIANIPQTRASLPPTPCEGATVRTLVVRDERSERDVGMRYLAASTRR